VYHSRHAGDVESHGEPGRLMARIALLSGSGAAETETEGGWNE
jgi:hypothetical protein